MENENLIVLSKEYKLGGLSHKKTDPYHNIKIENIEISYRNFYSNPRNVDFERNICKEFEFCDSESLKIFKNFLGD